MKEGGTMATPDLLFSLRNKFYLGACVLAYLAAINTGDLPNLSPEDAIERDSIVYRSYIAHGTYQVPPLKMNALEQTGDINSTRIGDKQLRITQLANAWLNLAVGGSKIQEAYLIFQDFSDKYQMTSLILNGKAVRCMHMGNFDQAESLLLEALNKDAKDPETLANLVVCSLHLGKPSHAS